MCCSKLIVMMKSSNHIQENRLRKEVEWPERLRRRSPEQRTQAIPYHPMQLRCLITLIFPETSCCGEGRHFHGRSNYRLKISVGYRRVLMSCGLIFVDNMMVMSPFSGDYTLCCIYCTWYRKIIAIYCMFNHK